MNVVMMKRKSRILVVKIKSMESQTLGKRWMFIVIITEQKPKSNDQSSALGDNASNVLQEDDSSDQ